MVIFKQKEKSWENRYPFLKEKMSTENLDSDTSEPCTFCRFILVNKYPGVRPIGVGEVLCRIEGTSIAWSLRDEVQEAAGLLQVSSWIKGGAEAAIHAMRSIFNADATDAVILLDASNSLTD